MKAIHELVAEHAPTPSVVYRLAWEVIDHPEAYEVLVRLAHELTRENKSHA